MRPGERGNEPSGSPEAGRPGRGNPAGRAAVGVIERNGKILIARRRQGILFGGKWEFPGGKVEEGETPEEALVRELREELAIEARVGELLCSTIHTYDFGTIELLAYRIASFTGEITALDHDEIQWVPAGELVHYEFPEASRPILAILGEDRER